MLTLWGGRQRFCDGVSRRTFLQLGACGAGLTLADVPPFVSMYGMSRGTEPGYLGVAHRPFTPSGEGEANLRLPGGIDAKRQENRKDLLGSFDKVRREIDATGTMKGMDSFTTRAF